MNLKWYKILFYNIYPFLKKLSFHLIYKRILAIFYLCVYLNWELFTCSISVFTINEMHTSVNNNIY